MKSMMFAKRLLPLAPAVILVLSMLFLFGCGTTAYPTETTVMQNLFRLTEDTYGELKHVTIGKTDSGRMVTEYIVSDSLLIDCETDPSTDELSEIRLRRIFEREAQDMSSEFEYYVLYLLKAYDENISLNVLNEIYDTLNIQDVTSGMEQYIENKTISYRYTVNEEEAVFTATYYE